MVPIIFALVVALVPADGKPTEAHVVAAFTSKAACEVALVQMEKNISNSDIFKDDPNAPAIEIARIAPGVQS
jgi:hypothetical protein